jgi:hypothetical protein
MTGCYKVYSYPQENEHPYDIAFEVNEGVTKVPREQSDLKSSVERTLDVLRGILKSTDDRFGKYFTELLALSRYGLVGDAAQPEQAMVTLQILQNRILDREKGTATERYMRAIVSALWIPTLVYASALSLLGLAIWVKLLPATLLSLWPIYPGLLFGLLFSAFMRCRAISFFELHVIESDRFAPWMKITFAVITLAITGAFLKAGVLEIKVGSLALSAFDVNQLSAFVFGVVVGIAQEIITARIESVKQGAARTQ